MKFQRTSREIKWAQELIRQSWSYRGTRVVEVCLRTGIFEELADEPATAAMIAERLKLLPNLVEKLLIVCAAKELAERDRQWWRLTARARATLLQDAPLYQGSAISHNANIGSGWFDLEHTVRGQRGVSVFNPRETRRPWSHVDWIMAMHNLAMAGRAAELATRLDLKKCRTLVDVGGGPGTYAMALCEKFPKLKATVFDLPETVAIAREVIERFKMSKRVATQAGDWDQDEFGKDVDVLLMSNVLHGGGSDAEMKLAKAARALKAGGLLVLQDFLLNARKTGPLMPALFNIHVGAYSIPELAALVKAAGFSKVRHEPMPEDLGTTLMTAVR